MRHRGRLLNRVRDAMRGDAAVSPEPPSPPIAPAPEAAAPARRSSSVRAAQTRLAEADVHQYEAEARYHRDRLALYRARVVSTRPTTPARLRELERDSAAADARLAHARER